MKLHSIYFNDLFFMKLVQRLLVLPLHYIITNNCPIPCTCHQNLTLKTLWEINSESDEIRNLIIVAVTLNKQIIHLNNSWRDRWITQYDL